VLTKAKMAEGPWLKPVLVGQFEFLEWTPDNHLRHSKFVGRVRTRRRAMSPRMTIVQLGFALPLRDNHS
jgi:ATP-dependent DNA ligase